MVVNSFVVFAQRLVLEGVGHRLGHLSLATWSTLKREQQTNPFNPYPKSVDSNPLLYLGAFLQPQRGDS